MLRLGHEVQVDDPCADGGLNSANYDCLFALHATRSHETILASRQHASTTPVVVCLTGTDLHLDIVGRHGARAKQQATDSLSLADFIVLLEPEGIHQLPAGLHQKVIVIRQSATKLQRLATGHKEARGDAFTACVIGHLRDVKDPFLAARAARLLPAESKIVINHYGAALNPEMKRQAEAEAAKCPRYRWHGAIGHVEAVRALAESQLMLLTSKVEGGPSVISEAIVNGVPILATNIPATKGLLGTKYPGLFPVGDADALMQQMRRAEQDSNYLTHLAESVEALQPYFTEEAELDMLRKLLQRIAPNHDSET